MLRSQNILSEQAPERLHRDQNVAYTRVAIAPDDTTNVVFTYTARGVVDSDRASLLTPRLITNEVASAWLSV